MNATQPPVARVLPDECAVVIGTSSRTGEAAYRQIQEEYGDKLLLLKSTEKPQDMKAAVKEAQKLGAKVVAIGGGDGTLRLAAPLCIEAGLPMAILPTGTGNALAHELEIPIDPAQALKFLFEEATPVTIDLGAFNDEPFVTVVTLGITSHIAKLLKHSQKGLLGRIVYLPIAIRAAIKTRPFRIRVESAAGDFDGMALQFVAAAGRTHAGPFPATENAANDDGKLSIYVVEAGPPKSLLKYVWMMLRGRHTELSEVWSVDVEKATVTLDRVGAFVIDGDPINAKTAKLEARRKELEVMA